MPQHSASLWRHRDFRTLWIGAMISNFGSAITSLALPLTAVVTLHASPAQMGVLGAVGTMPALLLSLLVGVWVDRVRRRPLLIGADLGRAVLIGAVPLIALCGILRMEYLYVVSFLAGILTLVFDIANTSLLPHVVSRDQLVEGNSKLVLSDSVASIAGPGVAGSLIQLLTAPLAMLVDAVSFLGSALCLSVIHPHEDTAARARADASVWQEIGEGLQWIIKTAALRAMTISSGLGSLAISMQQTVFILFVSRELGLEPTSVGIVLASSGIAAVLGALLADKVAKQWGSGPAIIWGTSLVCLSQGIIPLTSGPMPLQMVLLIGAQCLRGLGSPIYNINQLSVRQMITPERVLGRVNASRRFIVFGIRPIGALLGGALGEAIGLRWTFVTATVVMLVGLLYLMSSPLRTLREPPLPMSPSTA
jgi:MFS family permease